MKIFFAALALLGAVNCQAQSVQAQSVMDGSDKGLSSNDRAGLMKILRANLADPFGSQLMELTSPAAGTVCGSYNAKNTAGGFVGFRPFLAKMDDSSFTVVLPQIQVNERSSPELLQAALDRARQNLSALKSLESTCAQR
ncbi:hypothetical protein [Bradyrhizobium sp. STM 3561]|uniref:hypothetical protein n=1 Tax=Bradyrhizobium sp. STM 3561 TaxID=578923 RepID=UPI00388E5029